MCKLQPYYQSKFCLRHWNEYLVKNKNSTYIQTEIILMRRSALTYTLPHRTGSTGQCEMHVQLTRKLKKISKFGFLQTVSK